MRPPPRDEASTQRFVEQFAAALEASGLPRMPARMMAALLADEDGRMTSADVQDALACSAAAVSAASQYLTRVGCLRREREPGTRRDVYVLPDGVWENTLLHKDASLAALRVQLAQGIVAVGEGSDAAFRIRLLDEMLIVLEEVMADTGRRWEERKAALLAEREQGR